MLATTAYMTKKNRRIYSGGGPTVLTRRDLHGRRRTGSTDHIRRPVFGRFGGGEKDSEAW